MRSDRPSATATFIARCLVFWAREPFPQRLVGNHALALALASLHAAGIDERRWWRLCGIPWMRRLIWTCERWVLPGIVLHYVLRKRAIDHAVERALEMGCQSVVVLAAGFDALAWRTLRRHPQMQVIEVDHCATQAVKMRAVKHTRGFPLLRSCDLGTESVAALLDSQRPTVVVAEGLLMYFTEARVSDVLREIARVVVPGSRVVFTCMTGDRAGRLGFPAGHPLIDRWLAHHREVFRWGIRADALATFLARIGLHVVAHDHAHSMMRRFLPQGCRRRSAIGEDVVVAEPLSIKAI
jgi:methyltransferase (TIGR00027 family)